MDHCSACVVRNSAICSALDMDEIALLGKMGRHHKLVAGQTLMWEGEDSLLVANIIDGVLKLSTSLADGREQIVGVVYPSDFIGRPFGARTQRFGEATYDDDPIRWGVIATLCSGAWRVSCAGLYIALQLAFPALNLGLEWTTFGRLRPLHTSAVIFAFGGNALIATSFYIVQRTCRARLAFPASPVRVLGLPAVHRAGRDRLSAGHHPGKEYAEPEWYVDLWLTVVWVAYLACSSARS
jgi:hypothetical protein